MTPITPTLVHKSRQATTALQKLDNSDAPPCAVLLGGIEGIQGRRSRVSALVRCRPPLRGLGLRKGSETFAKSPCAYSKQLPRSLCDMGSNMQLRVPELEAKVLRSSVHCSTERNNNHQKQDKP